MRVKYIGDEVMAVFDGATMVNDSANFISRISEIQESIRIVTGETTALKVAIDIGPVFCIAIPGHDQLDVLGTTVDRCARIAKYARPGVVLSSYNYRISCNPVYKWSSVGEPFLKGIGNVKIFALGEEDFQIQETTEILASELTEFKERVAKYEEERQQLELENQELKGMNLRLQADYEKMGSQANLSDCVVESEPSDESEQLWDSIEQKLSSLKRLIRDSGVPAKQYARFLFLYMQKTGDYYNQAENKVFDECIQAKLVEERDGTYYIDESNRRNKAVISLMAELEKQLEEFEDKFREEDEDELYDYSLSVVEFWDDKLDFNVRYW